MTKIRMIKISNSKILKIIFLLFGVFFLIVPLFHIFAEEQDPTKITDQKPCEDAGFLWTEAGGCVSKSQTAIIEYVQNLYRIVLPIGIGLTILVIIYGGIQYMTSAGNPDQLTQAKEIIVGAVLGLLLLVLIYIIVDMLGHKPPANTNTTTPTTNTSNP